MRYMTGGRVKMPLVIRTQQGGGRGNGAQHSQSLEAVFAHTPGPAGRAAQHPCGREGLAQDRAAPGQPGDLHRAQAALQHEGPGARWRVHDSVRRGRGQGGGAATSRSSATRARCCMRSRRPRRRRRDGISVEVIDLRTICPLDLDAILKSVKKTGRLIVAHEAHRSLGFGAEMAVARAGAGIRLPGRAGHAGRRRARADPGLQAAGRRRAARQAAHPGSHSRDCRVSAQLADLILRVYGDREVSVDGRSAGPGLQAPSAAQDRLRHRASSAAAASSIMPRCRPTGSTA